MQLTKKGLTNHNRIILDQNENLTVNNVNIRGELRYSGLQLQRSVYHPPIRLTISTEKELYQDNEMFMWAPNNETAIVIPQTGLYHVNIRVYDCATQFESSGSGISFWVNDIYEDIFVSGSDSTHFISCTRMFQTGDMLSVRSVLTNKILKDHPQAYCFEVCLIR
jgi:hypothetical protein